MITWGSNLAFRISAVAWFVAVAAVREERGTRREERGARRSEVRGARSEERGARSDEQEAMRLERGQGVEERRAQESPNSLDARVAEHLVSCWVAHGALFGPTQLCSGSLSVPAFFRFFLGTLVPAPPPSEVLDLQPLLSVFL